MKLVCLLFVAALLGLSAGCASAVHRAPTRLTTPDGAATPPQHATLTVHGLACPLCAHNIDKQLLRLDGVQEVDVDLGAGLVNVRFVKGKQPSDDALTAAVEAGGFTLIGITRH